MQITKQSDGKLYNPNLHKETKPAYNSLDVCKLIMAICVVAIHTQPFANASNSRLYALYSLVAAMAVPFFFLTSGYLLGNKLCISSEPQHAVAAVNKQLAKIVKMYLIWNAIYLPLAIYGYYLDGNSLFLSIYYYMKGLILIGEHYNSWQLWYLLSSIYALIVISVSLRFGARIRSFPIISLLAAIISIGVNELVLYSGTLPGVLQLLRKIFFITIMNGRIIQGLIYLPVGIYLAQKPLTTKVCFPLFILTFLCNYFVENRAISSVLLVFTSIAFFGIICSIRLKDRAIYPILRNLSTKIYLVHMYVWTAYYLAVYGETTVGLDCFVITTTVSFLISYLYYLLEKRIMSKYAFKNTLENAKIH